jgi:hypothetical protein
MKHPLKDRTPAPWQRTRGNARQTEDGWEGAFTYDRCGRCGSNKKFVSKKRHEDGERYCGYCLEAMATGRGEE